MTSLRRASNLALLAACCAAPVATQARVAPDPLPPWESLPIKESVVVEVPSDEIGTRMELPTAEAKRMPAFVWDIAYARLPDGQVRTLRYELQTMNGVFLSYHGTLEDMGPHAVEVTSMSEILPTGAMEYTDAEGLVTVLDKVTFMSMGGVSDGGQVVVQPGFGTGRAAGCWGTSTMTCSGLCFNGQDPDWGWQFFWCAEELIHNVRTCWCNDFESCPFNVSYSCMSDSNCTATCSLGGLACSCQ